MIVFWIVALVVGLTVAAAASRRAVTHAIGASEQAGVSAGLVGVTIVAIGTDLPEIAASIIAAIRGEGDLIIGDAAGSAFTQVSLVLAILCLAAAITADRLSIATIGALTVAALLLVAVLVSDGVFSRLDGLLLVALWVGSLLVSYVVTPPHDQPPTGRRSDAARAALRSLGWLAVVAGASTLVVESFIELTEDIGVPQLVASAVVLSLGTSLPELVVDLTALRRGAVALALGDLFGSSLLDATLAIGIGPMLRATTVSDDATTACVIAAVGVALSTLVVMTRRTHRFPSAALLFIVYGAVTAWMIIATG